MPRRRDDDFDDDDYFPPEAQRKPEGPFPFWSVGGVVFGVILLACLALFWARSSRQAAAERNAVEIAHAEQAMTARPADRRARVSNWTLAMGTWHREPKGKDDTNYPYRFEFRPDRTATMTRTNFDGSVQVMECRVEVFVDDRDDLAMQLHNPDGLYSYRFRFQPDGTLVLNDGAGGLFFTHAK